MTNKVSKVCVLGGCVDSDDGLKFDLNKLLEAFAKPGLGVEAKAVVGVCQKALFYHPGPRRRSGRSPTCALPRYALSSP